ncbi:MAG: 2-oxo-4-hydroxy-4-carboxy-5-ureidoimidazoline decarboxylase [Bacteroidota bacterium]
MELNKLNDLLLVDLKEVLYKCCGSKNWVNMMMRYRPYHSWEYLENLAELVWFDDCSEDDWKEAFAHHPKIGDLKSLEEKFTSTIDMASKEQEKVESASMEVLEALAAGNQAYESKFGYIFIVFATGKTAEEMLEILQERLENSPKMEMMIAASEQYKITRLRLEKFLTS